MRGARALGAILGRAVGGLLPPTCVICGSATTRREAPCCGPCFARLPAVLPPRCRRCGATRLLDAGGEGSCVECGGWSPSLVRARSPCRMERGAARLVHALKFEGWSSAALRMGEAMLHGLGELTGGAPHLLVPVPLSPARLRERGYNQAELLAKALAGAEAGLRVERLLARRPGGRRQARLGRREREQNVKQRFELRSDRPPPVLPVVLVDDVLTTGGTAGACAEVLEGGGYRCAGVVTFARALHASVDRPGGP